MKWLEMTSQSVFLFFSALPSAQSLSTTTIDSFIITYWACIRQTYTHHQSSHLFILFNVQYSTIFCSFHFRFLYFVFAFNWMWVLSIDLFLHFIRTQSLHPLWKRLQRRKMKQKKKLILNKHLNSIDIQNTSTKRSYRYCYRYVCRSFFSV